ncbi:RPA_C domain-containing protein [Haematococcus lacustris]|uniref:RPA_C domain-containing protein n=1 Tax=Haematococcus lacustris TaxID=44745 RepID=A0A699ZT91_HAELA|nr:RPA_C domain-containing protein [Haematococcus lacustris]
MAYNGFDMGASQFGGAGFMTRHASLAQLQLNLVGELTRPIDCFCSPQPAGDSSYGGGKKKSSGQDSLRYLTVLQIRKENENRDDEGWWVDGVEVNTVRSPGNRGSRLDMLSPFPSASAMRCCHCCCPQCTLVGRLTRVEENNTRALLTLNDGSGEIMVAMFLQDDDPELLARQRATMRMGSYVRVYGHLQRFDGALQLKAYNIRSITDFNEASAGHASHSTAGWEQPAPVQAGGAHGYHEEGAGGHALRASCVGCGLRGVWVRYSGQWSHHSANHHQGGVSGSDAAPSLVWPPAGHHILQRGNAPAMASTQMPCHRANMGCLKPLPWCGSVPQPTSSLLAATELLQITYHNLQVICQRLHLTQGSAAAPTAAMSGAMVSKPLMAPAAAAAIPQAAGQDGLDNLHQTVLNVYTDPAFANSSNGLATHDLIQQLAARGFRFTPAQVTGAVEHLIEQGVLFTTIDDQHARAASSAVM